jgi:hypothetical protein
MFCKNCSLKPLPLLSLHDAQPQVERTGRKQRATINSGGGLPLTITLAVNVDHRGCCPNRKLHYRVSRCALGLAAARCRVQASVCSGYCRRESESGTATSTNVVGLAERS